MLLSTILGFVLSGDPRLQHEVLTSALHQFPVIGGDLAQPKRLGGGPVGFVVGILGSLYGGLGVAQAFQYAVNTAWGVPRNNRPNPFRARGRGLLLLATAGKAQRSKGFEHVDVNFDPPSPEPEPDDPSP